MKFNSKAKILIGISVVVLLIVASTVFLSSTSTSTVPDPNESSGDKKGEATRSSVVHNDGLNGNEPEVLGSNGTVKSGSLHSDSGSESETDEDVRSVLGLRTNSEHGGTNEIVQEDQEESGTKDKGPTDCKYRISGKFREGYECGSELIEDDSQGSEQKYQMFYVKKKGDNDELERIRTMLKQFLYQNTGETKKTIDYFVGLGKLKRNLQVYFKRPKMKKGSIEEKMVQDIPRQGWKDFILSLSSDEAKAWENDTVIFVINENEKKIVESSEIEIDYSASIQWTSTGERVKIVIQAPSLFSSPKYVYDQQLVGANGSVKARFIQFQSNPSGSPNDPFTINWENPRQVRIDNFIVVYDNCKDIVKLFDKIQSTNLNDAFEYHKKSYVNFHNLNILIINTENSEL